MTQTQFCLLTLIVTTPAAWCADFVKDVQPILETSCYACHGSKLQMGGLRLDSKKAALAGGQSGASIEPGKAADSLLYKRIAGIGGQARMPMGGKPLEPAQLAAIRSWIDQGAVWPESSANAGEKKHWAYIPPKRPPLPKVTRAGWTANPIDRFILARLEKEGLAPSPEADRITLLRRLSLDLIGLPPTPAEIDAFLKDTSGNAYEKQVDRLLASPHYGERWARLWLDAARYADSNGFEKDKPRQVWFYRDWVIRAFNRDLPYNEFVIDQIAGDLLPNAGQDELVATGFLRNSMTNEEGGVDPEQFRMEAMFDRMDAIGKSVLGVTIQCAQCHDHKFDPLTQEEYYRLFAFINNTHEANVAVYTPEEQKKRSAIFAQIREIENGLQRSRPDWRERMAQWEDGMRSNQPEWIVLRPEIDDISTGGQKYMPQPDGSLLAGGYAPTSLRFKMSVKTDVKNITGFRLELMTDPNLPLGGPGRSGRGTCYLTEFEVEASQAGSGEKPAKIKFARATADIALPSTPMPGDAKKRVAGPIEYAIDGKDTTAWSIDAGPGLRNQPRKAVFETAEPIPNPNGTTLDIYLSQKHGSSLSSDIADSENLGRFRVSLTTRPGVVADPLPKEVRDILETPRKNRTPMQEQTAFAFWRTTVPEWSEANGKIAELWRQHPEGSSQLALEPREQKRETHMLDRGDFLKPARVVEPGVPSFLNPLPANAPPTRLTFARWLVDRSSPTTARAMVNRMWQAYFGAGLVTTTENLGKQSEPPTHPELLDWLAVELMDRNWSLKAIHRTIVTSATYRQSSRVSKELYSRDPYNALLARGPRFRVDAEIVRDIALAASGLLNEKVGGPSVFPPAPEFLFKPPASYGPKSWTESTGPDRYRRALYTFRYRSVPYPMLQTFDAPNGDISCVRRPRSNTPLQALTTLNEPLFIESARALAIRTLAEGGRTDQERLAYAVSRCLSRKPTETESQKLLALLNKETRRFAGGGLNPWELAASDPAHPPTLPNGATPAQAAAWTAVSRVLLNLDETITKE
ncbi:MAG TPA: PSD1 and planctomycete cytochrome C domain-containing protein [Bryobacteraceae bacterium]|jgi:hypothetical protein|nr:PSD1 and planctomycete cytochrome C domain-containing protein [Bryobacteraceae bacterium]